MRSLICCHAFALRWHERDAAHPGELYREHLRSLKKAEAQHMQIIGDTGTGKSALMFQALRQVRSRGDSAIVYDPAREFVKRFYDPARGDVILNPLDKRCPYWGPAERQLELLPEIQSLLA
ncbi:MAG TPA: type IV secretion system DNA-binding domain-containing protein [Terriglobales bacterium]|nr:type IV secretion system DNA-binding domain-containing protein [Terriglobales bacterium]